jgi:ABC-2 type transport system permease protein
MPENAFIEVKEKGWLTGFSNMFDNENGQWWRTEKWIIQLTAWLVLLNLSLAFLLYVRPYITGEAGSPGLVQANVRMVSGLFFSLAGIYLPFGIAIMTHDAIIRERELRTMAWVLPKPISRTSFALSKVIANTIGVMVLMVLVPGIVAYGMISFYNGSFINALNFFGALGILALLCMFYISLVFMLGSITKSRYAVLGVTAIYIYHDEPGGRGSTAKNRLVSILEAFVHGRRPLGVWAAVIGCPGTVHRRGIIDRGHAHRNANPARKDRDMK